MADGDNFRKSHDSVGNLERAGNLKGEYEYRLVNNYAFLDEENEFYYDKAAGVIYYIPKADQNLSDLTFGIPMVDEIFTIENVDNLTFDNLTFTGTGSNHMTKHGHMSGQAGSLKKTNVNRESGWNDDAAIVVRNTKNFTVKNCNFIELEYHAIYMAGTVQDVLITGNNFDAIGASAIAAPVAVYYVEVTNNYLHNIADMYNNAVAIYFMKAYELDILYNSVVNSAYSAVSVGWTWGWARGDTPEQNVNCDYFEVAYNYFENFMYFMYDGGAVYFNGGSMDIKNDKLINAIHDNYAFIGSREGPVKCGKTSTVWYIDGGGSHTYIFDNVVWVDEEALSMHSYIAYQGADNWVYNYDKPAQQAYRVTSEDNYFINLYQDYLTMGHGRNKALFYLYEINSTILVKDDPYIKELEYKALFENGELNEHGEKMKEHMLIDASTYQLVLEDMTRALHVYEIIAGVGCEKTAERPLAKPDAVDLSEYYQKTFSNYKDAEKDKSMQDARYVDGDDIADKDFFH
jgi:hypothetical protein